MMMMMMLLLAMMLRMMMMMVMMLMMMLMTCDGVGGDEHNWAVSVYENFQPARKEGYTNSWATLTELSKRLRRAVKHSATSSGSSMPLLRPRAFGTPASAHCSANHLSRCSGLSRAGWTVPATAALTSPQSTWAPRAQSQGHRTERAC